MMALTIRQPWAYAIIHLGKDVENRSWPTEHRGPLAIHAATKLDRNGDVFLKRLGFAPADEDMVLGAVIGIVDVTDCVRNHASPWAVNGHYHWLLNNPRALSVPLQIRGQLGLFEVTLRF